MGQVSTQVGTFTADATDRWSDNIWGHPDFQPIAWRENGLGYMFEDDFAGVCPNTDAGLFEGAGESPGKGYVFYGDTGVLIKAEPAVAGGALQISVNDTDNDEGVISGSAPAYVVSDTAANAKRLWFEARVSKASVANDALATFVGLAWDHGNSISVAKTACLTDTNGALGAFSFLGFHVDHADGDAMDFVFKADSQSAVVVKAGVHVPVAGEYVKVGFFYDPEATPAKQITIFVNGLPQATFVTATQIAAATFPDAEPMAPVWVTKVGESSEVKAQMSRWRVAQLL